MNCSKRVRNKTIEELKSNGLSEIQTMCKNVLKCAIQKHFMGLVMTCY